MQGTYLSTDSPGFLTYSVSKHIITLQSMYWLNNYYPANTRRYLDVVSTFFERNGRQMDVKTTLCAYKNPVNTKRYLDIDST